MGSSTLKKGAAMALIQCNFFSEALQGNTAIYIILPTPDVGDMLLGKSQEYYTQRRAFQTVYLFHGMYGDSADWVRGARIEIYALKYKVAFVTASVGNSYYTDFPQGPAYFDFVSRELPRFVQYHFPLSSRREDNFTAGFSMGGYGAFKVALSRPDQFSAAVSLSGALDYTATLARLEGEEPGGWPWGEPGSPRRAQGDLLEIFKKLKGSPHLPPKLYQACGTEDFLYEDNLHMRDALQGLGADLTYAEGPGNHDWGYWDKEIQSALRWLPLKGILGGPDTGT